MFRRNSDTSAFTIIGGVDQIFLAIVYKALAPSYKREKWAKLFGDKLGKTNLYVLAII